MKEYGCEHVAGHVLSLVTQTRRILDAQYSALHEC